VKNFSKYLKTVEYCYNIFIVITFFDKTKLYFLLHKNERKRRSKDRRI